MQVAAAATAAATAMSALACRDAGEGGLFTHN